MTTDHNDPRTASAHERLVYFTEDQLVAQLSFDEAGDGECTTSASALRRCALKWAQSYFCEPVMDAGDVEEFIYAPVQILRCVDGDDLGTTVDLDEHCLWSFAADAIDPSRFPVDCLDDGSTEGWDIVQRDD